MGAQLQKSRRPAVTARPHTLPTPPPAPAWPPRSAPAVALESGSTGSHADRDVGLGLLFRFVLATSVVVAVVILVNAVGQDWILIPAMAIHLAVTYAVLRGIFLLMEDGNESDPPRQAAQTSGARHA